MHEVMVFKSGTHLFIISYMKKWLGLTFGCKGYILICQVFIVSTPRNYVNQVTQWHPYLVFTEFRSQNPLQLSSWRRVHTHTTTLRFEPATFDAIYHSSISWTTSRDNSKLLLCVHRYAIGKTAIFSLITLPMVSSLSVCIVSLNL